ncbi:MAG: hypothetical protein QG620_18 [Patescibacteria group bacterium]|nr:hypothetical protein [Patescibacteria group bacterium]
MQTKYSTGVSCFLILVFWPAFVGAQNYSHIKTGGFDYDYNLALNSSTEAEWLATHHDMVIGLQDYATSKLAESVYNNMKTANPDVKFLTYIPFNTVLPAMSTWMENWCDVNGRIKEDLYYHYYFDTDVRLRNNQIVNYKGYGGGTASTLAQSRVPSVWHSGLYPNINPTSQTFRDAYQAMALEFMTVDVNEGKFTDGIFLDTFDGTVDDYFNLHLENTIEMRTLELIDSTTARNRAQNDLIDARDELEYYLSIQTSRESRVIPNAAEADYVFGSRASLYANRYTSSYNEMGIEYLVSSVYTSTLRIPRLKQLYDSMVNGILYFNNSQTNYNTRFGFTGSDDDLTEEEWLGFNQYILAIHYLVNHPNGYFSFHRGSAGYYGGEAGSMRTTHWRNNIEYDIGNPVVRQGVDSWGQSNTNRFFVFADGELQYQVLGREYQNALALAKFGNVGGWANIGANPLIHQLGGNYQRLQIDNTLGPVISEITLGFGEGAILIKADNQSNATAPLSPVNLSVR